MDHFFWESLAAFHINAVHHLQYVLLNNRCFLLSLAACVCTMILSWCEKKGTVVREEQNIL